MSFVSDDTVYPMTDGACDAYTGHENLTLVGDYTSTVDETYAWCDYDVILYGLSSSLGTVYFDELTADDTGNTRACKLGQYVEIDKNAVATLQWALSSDDTLSLTGTAASSRYDSVTLEIKKIATQSTISTNVWNASLLVMSTQISTWETGYYIATFCATKGSDVYYFDLILCLKD